MKYELILSYISDYRIVSGNKEVQFNCPYCTDTRKRMYFNLETGKHYCHNCGTKSSNPVGIISKLSGLSIRELVKEFEDLLSPNLVGSKNLMEELYSKLEVKEGYQREEQEESYGVPLGFIPLDFRSNNPLIRRAINHLKSRGFDKRKIKLLRAGISLDKKYRNRVILPIYNSNNICEFYVARDITGKSKLKELSASTLYKTKSEVIWNLYRASETGVLVISEGVYDAVSWGLSGVALLGKRVSEEQLILLNSVKNKVEEVYVALDEDARKEAVELASTLITIGYKNVKIVSVKSDPNDMLRSGENMVKVLSCAKKYVSSIKMLGG